MGILAIFLSLPTSDSVDLTDHHHQYRNAGFFLWVDLAPFLPSRDATEEGWKAEQDLRDAITRAKIPLASGAAYRAERPGWFRIIFTVDKDSVEESLRRYRISNSVVFCLM